MLVAMMWNVALAEEPVAPTVAPPPNLARAATLMPDATTATLQSAIVGFGAGHFYAKEYTAGGVFAGAQGLGVLIAAFGGMAYSKELEKKTYQQDTTDSTTIIGAGTMVFLLGRTLDVAFAPGSVRRAHDRIVAEGG